MKLLMGGLVLAAIAGCTTASDLLRGAPEITATTKKSPKEYALCVFPAWQDYRSSANLSETIDGYRIVVGTEANGQTDDVLDIKSDGSGSKVMLYQRAAWAQLGRGELRNSLNRCL
ncbi:hypothetical protein [Pseudomonas sp. TTU2014-080ASC]|uniref:hypothetical protein n=1 Tax=Pseudomonas sp. TTU2014-080ASC TaxID=1729724 RepID=UPI00071896BC|nr:hypothetical protein [Pseudomonas sp. TTU2014-080ASC]KRW62328.1 hypothetical protein AO726_02585 [Pseudomonas sp. TTU2014-080ASC]